MPMELLPSNCPSCLRYLAVIRRLLREYVPPGRVADLLEGDATLTREELTAILRKEKQHGTVLVG